MLPKVLFQNSDNIEPIKHKDSSTVVIVRKRREGKLQDNLAFRLGEGRMLVTSALKTLYGGQFTLSTRLEKTNMFELCKAGKVLPRLFG